RLGDHGGPGGGARRGCLPHGRVATASGGRETVLARNRITPLSGFSVISVRLFCPSTRRIGDSSFTVFDSAAVAGSQNTVPPVNSRRASAPGAGMAGGCRASPNGASHSGHQTCRCP